MRTIDILEVARVLCNIQREYPQYTIEFMQKKNSGLLIRNKHRKDPGIHIIKFEWDGKEGSPFLPDTHPNVILVNNTQNIKRWGIHSNSITSLNICVDQNHELYSLAKTILHKIDKKLYNKGFCFDSSPAVIVMAGAKVLRRGYG